MNINIILIIIFLALFILFLIFSLYRRAEIKKAEKLRIVKENNKKLSNKVIKYKNDDLPESNLNTEEVKKRIIIKKEKTDKISQKDVISEAISEIGDFEKIKRNILEGKKNMTNIADVSTDYSPINILVVDDSKVFLKKTKNLLINLEANYSITTAIDGEDAFHKLSIDKTKFDLIITDMDMPRMDGGELINFIKRDVTLSVIPIIVITGKPKLISNGLEDKVDGVLEKPYKDEDLIYQTKSLLSN